MKKLSRVLTHFLHFTRKETIEILPKYRILQNNMQVKNVVLLIGALCVGGESSLMAQVVNPTPPAPPGLVPGKAGSGSSATTAFPKPIMSQVPPPAFRPATPAHPGANTPTQVGVKELVWDSMNKEYDPKPGEAKAPFTFNLTNNSDHEIVITNAITSCGCTVAKLPSNPWILPAGGNGQINAEMTLAGKPPGATRKTITVNTSAGVENLSVTVHMPQPQPLTAGQMTGTDRARNAQLAAANRQVVFQGTCADCHVKKGIDKLDQQLYVADCGICHDSPQRAAGVPDLHHLPHPTDFPYWKMWISDSQPGKMMPAFAQRNGGPLSDQQIDSLASFLASTISHQPPAAPAGRIVPTQLK